MVDNYDFPAGRISILKAGEEIGCNRNGDSLYADYDFVRVCQVGHVTVRLEKDAFLALLSLVQQNKIVEVLPDWHL